MIELLVVIGVLIMLMAFLLPALQRAKETAESSACLNSQKQITVAWLMYADDSDESLGATNIYSTGTPVPETYAGIAPWNIAIVGNQYVEPTVLACRSDSDRANYRTGTQVGSDWLSAAMNDLMDTSFTATTSPATIRDFGLPNSYAANYALGWSEAGGNGDSYGRARLTTVSNNNDPDRYWIMTDSARRDPATYGDGTYGFVGVWPGRGLASGSWQAGVRHNRGRIWAYLDGHVGFLQAMAVEAVPTFTDEGSVTRYYLEQHNLEMEPGGSGSGTATYSAGSPLGRFVSIPYSKY